MTFGIKGISAKEMQDQLGHRRYASIWKMMHKVRMRMGKQDAQYQLTDMIEFDEGYFSTAIAEKTKLKPGKVVRVSVMLK